MSIVIDRDHICVYTFKSEKCLDMKTVGICCLICSKTLKEISRQSFQYDLDTLQWAVMGWQRCHLWVSCSYSTCCQVSLYVPPSSVDGDELMSDCLKASLRCSVHTLCISGHSACLPAPHLCVLRVMLNKSAPARTYNLITNATFPAAAVIMENKLRSSQED